MIRHRKSTAATNRDRWLISYADFITLLLALFVVLFASSRPDFVRAKQVSNAVTAALHQKQPGPSAEASLEDLQRRLAADIRSGKVDVHVESRGMVISLREAAYFPAGGDEIARAEYGSLAQIADAIRSIPNPIGLEGHTDSTPIHNRKFRSNWELSAARGIAILTLLEERFGIPGDRFAVTGYAEMKPLDSNASAAGRARNRRVDIVILNDSHPVQ
jgi:chemotaxis protein MotB